MGKYLYFDTMATISPIFSMEYKSKVVFRRFQSQNENIHFIENLKNN